MALRQAGLISRAEAAASLVITPRTREGLRLRRIMTSNHSTTLQHATIINDTARVGFFRIIGLGGSHLLSPREMEVSGNLRGTNMLDYMVHKLGFGGYPIVEGESLTISLDTGTADIFAVYDVYDSADVKSTEMCGSKASDVLYLNYGTNLAAKTTAAYAKLDSSRNPAEMVAFPFGAAGAGLLPSGRKAHIYLIGGQAMGRFVSGGNTMGTQYLRPRVGASPAQTIIDRNDVGIPFFGTIPGASTDYTSVRQGIPSNPCPFDEEQGILSELDFNGNDEFSLQLSGVLAGTGQLNAADVDVWSLQRVSLA